MDVVGLVSHGHLREAGKVHQGQLQQPRARHFQVDGLVHHALVVARQLRRARFDGAAHFVEVEEPTPPLLLAPLHFVSNEVRELAPLLLRPFGVGRIGEGRGELRLGACSCSTSGTRVTMPVPRGRMLWPTILSRTCLGEKKK